MFDAHPIFPSGDLPYFHSTRYFLLFCHRSCASESWEFWYPDPMQFHKSLRFLVFQRRQRFTSTRAGIGRPACSSGPPSDSFCNVFIRGEIKATDKLLTGLCEASSFLQLEGFPRISQSTLFDVGHGRKTEIRFFDRWKHFSRMQSAN